MKTLLLTLLTLPTLAFAQVEQRSLRLIPLGQVPEWKEKLEGDIRKGLVAPPGSNIAKMLTIPSGKDAVQSVQPSLGAFTKFLNFGPKETKLNLFEGKVAAGDPWLTVPMPQFEIGLGVLFRDPAKMSWLQPRLLFFDDSKDAFPAGNIRFINVSEQNVLVIVGKSRPQRILPGKSLMLPVVEGDNRLMLGFEDKANNNKQEVIFENSVRVSKEQRIQSFIYKNQLKKAGAKPKFLWKPEPLPAL